MTKLKTLEMSGTRLHDSSPLANLTDLETLYIGDANIDDITPLAQHRHFHALEWCGTTIVHMMP